MKNFRLLFLLFLGACSSAPVQEISLLPLDPEACVGQVPATVQGLAVVSNEGLIAAARGLNNKGGVCAAAVFNATEPLTVYRVYDSKSGCPYGRWWSLSRPEGSREQYRSAYAICPEWGALDRLISCQLKPGSQIVLGTTQSMECKETAYPKSADIQVYIPNDSATKAIYIDNCVEEEAWPGIQPLPVVVNSQESSDNSPGTANGRTP
jgi:hypothetical protein